METLQVSNEKTLKVIVATEFIYAGSISAFLVVPILIGVTTSVLRLILANTLNIHINAFFTAGAITNFYLTLFQVFPPLIILPGFIHGLLFHQLHERDVKITFLKENPLHKRPS